MYQPDVLVLGPGGLKGIIELGALQKLYEEGVMRKVSVIVGCSIGSIIGLLLSCGYSPVEILSFSKTINNLLDFIPKKWTVGQLMKVKGLVDPKTIQLRLEEFIVKKLGFIPSLTKLKSITGITLCTVSTNVDEENYNYINLENNPDMKCTEAAVIGINMPGIIGPYEINGTIFVDGALTNPYPINIYDKDNLESLGIYIEEMYDKTDVIQVSFLLFLKVSIAMIRKLIIQHSSEKCRHLCLNTNVKDPTGIFEVDRDDLFKMGYDQASDFLSSVKN